MPGNNQGPVFAILYVIVIAVLLSIGVMVLQGVDDSAALSAGTSASGTLTVSSNPSDGDLVNVSGDTYEFDNEGNTSEGNLAVTIGVNESVSNTNFISKVNTLGTEAVTASQGTGNSSTLTADSSGTAGNSITTTENSAVLSFGSATLSGGTEADDFYSASTSVSTGTQNALSMSTVLLIVIVAVAILSALFGIFAILIRKP